MRQRMPYTSVKPFLPHALAATLVVYGVPMIVTLGLLGGGSAAPPLPVALAAGLILSLAAGGIGSWAWSRRVESREISFGELILWSWFRRSQAEDRIERDAKALALDPLGVPTAPPAGEPRDQGATLRDLSLALEVKDTYTHGHSRRVERHVKRTGEGLGLTESDLDELALAAALHDVGKIRVPDRVLRKPGDLTIEERVAVEEHALVGAAMVAPIGDEGLIQAVRHHHERWDGRGYPQGLAGGDIPLHARIIAVCDAYDAMTSTRPYRPSLGHGHAIEVLREETGSQFDPDVVEAFISTLPTRIPVAAMALFALPLRLLRELAVPARRVGLQSLAPAAGAVGAAAVMGAAVFSPIPAPAPAIAAEATQVEEGNPELGIQVPDQVLGEKAERTQRKPAAEPTPAPAVETATEEEAPVEVAEAQPEPRPEPKPKPVTEPEPTPEPEPAVVDCRPGPAQGKGKGPPDCPRGRGKKG
ncbi:MAG: HD domain-containing protein [Actinobacteria bacterium]|nr:HD domain-containing protein [Actinomycetota bacterium]